MQATIQPIKVLSRFANRLTVVQASASRPPSFYWYAQEVVTSGGIESVTELARGQVAMTDEQWLNYPVGGTRATDDAYEIACVIANDPALDGVEIV